LTGKTCQAHEHLSDLTPIFFCEVQKKRQPEGCLFVVRGS
jgi:hypothetical protein